MHELQNLILLYHCTRGFDICECRIACTKVDITNLQYNYNKVEIQISRHKQRITIQMKKTKATKIDWFYGV